MCFRRIDFAPPYVAPILVLLTAVGGAGPAFAAGNSGGAPAAGAPPASSAAPAAAPPASAAPASSAPPAAAAAPAAAPLPAVADPNFKFGERAKITGSRWLATGNLGLLIASGNSNVTSVSGGLFLSWTDPHNRVTLDSSAAYAHQTTLTVSPGATKAGYVSAGDIQSAGSTGAQNWSVRPRYDRHFDDNDSAFVSVAAGSDIPSGKQLTLGGQAGIARTLLAKNPHEIDVEAGYDYTHEEYVYPAGSGVSLHSVRAFGSYRLKLAEDISARTSVEVLANLLGEDTPLGHVGSFVDTRVNWRNVLSAKVWKNISARFVFTAKYDNWPAPLPPLSLPFAPGFMPASNKLDTQTEFNIVMNFL